MEIMLQLKEKNEILLDAKHELSEMREENQNQMESMRELNLWWQDFLVSLEQVSEEVHEVHSDWNFQILHSD